MSEEITDEEAERLGDRLTAFLSEPANRSRLLQGLGLSEEEALVAEELPAIDVLRLLMHAKAEEIRRRNEELEQHLRLVRELIKDLED